MPANNRTGRTPVTGTLPVLLLRIDMEGKGGKLGGPSGPDHALQVPFRGARPAVLQICFRAVSYGREASFRAASYSRAAQPYAQCYTAEQRSFSRGTRITASRLIERHCRPHSAAFRAVIQPHSVASRVSGSCFSRKELLDDPIVGFGCKEIDSAVDEGEYQEASARTEHEE